MPSEDLIWSPPWQDKWVGGVYVCWRKGLRRGRNRTDGGWGSFKEFSVQFSSVAQLRPTLRPHESQHARPPCPSPAPRVHSDSRPSSPWCHPAISSSVVPFSSCPQSLPASGSFPMSQLFTWGGQSTGVSALASFHPKNTQGWETKVMKQWI